MQTLVYETELRQAVTEQGVKPENPQRVHQLILKGDTEEDFITLAIILAWLREKAAREGAPIIEEEAANLPRKAEAAKNN